MAAQPINTFAILHRVKTHPGMVEEYAGRIKAHALPIMRTIDGFRGYFVVAVTKDTAISVSLFANRTAAENGWQTLRPSFGENIGPVLASLEETYGEVVVSEIAGAV